MLSITVNVELMQQNISGAAGNQLRFDDVCFYDHLELYLELKIWLRVCNPIRDQAKEELQC